MYIYLDSWNLNQICTHINNTLEYLLPFITFLSNVAKNGYLYVDTKNQKGQILAVQRHEDTINEEDSDSPDFRMFIADCSLYR